MINWLDKLDKIRRLLLWFGFHLKAHGWRCLQCGHSSSFFFIIHGFGAHSRHEESPDTDLLRATSFGDFRGVPFEERTQGWGAQTLHSEPSDFLRTQGFGAQTLQTPGSPAGFFLMHLPGGQYLHSSSLPFVFKTQGFGAHTLQSDDWLCDLFMTQGPLQTLQSEAALLADLVRALLITQGPGAQSLQSLTSSVFRFLRVQGWGEHTSDGKVFWF